MDHLVGICPVCGGPLRVAKGAHDIWESEDVPLSGYIPNTLHSGLRDGLYATKLAPKCAECGHEQIDGAVLVESGVFLGFKDHPRTAELRSQVRGDFPRHWVFIE